VLTERPEVAVTLSLRIVAPDGSITHPAVRKAVQVTAPGDIAGVSSSVVVRTYPPDQTTDFAANLLVYIEFYEEDFAWRYTPAIACAAPSDPKEPTNNDWKRLRPWLFLLVLKGEEFTPHPPVNAPLPFISLLPSTLDAALPPADETWAWAHVQVARKLNSTTGPTLSAELRGILGTDPDSGVSRIVSPRHLKTNTAYWAFLVPAFETGRLAGLGLDPAGVLAQDPAWNLSSPSNLRPLDFPVYFQWQFKTGDYGDFESLVSSLLPMKADASLGGRDLLIDIPGSGLEGNEGTDTVKLEGALQPRGFVRGQWPEPKNGWECGFRDALQARVNLPDSLQQSGGVDDPVVSPPIYGQWPAGANRVDSTSVPWLRDLNLDPRSRAVAGVGTQLVQDNQDVFMEDAWKQIGDVDAANQRLREAQLAKWTNIALYEKHVKTADSDTLLRMTAPHHRYLRNNDGTPARTVEGTIKNSRIPTAAVSNAFKKMVRPSSPIIRRISHNGERVLPMPIADFNQASLTTAPLKLAPPTAVAFSAAQAAISQGVDLFHTHAVIQAQQAFMAILGSADQSHLSIPDLLAAAKAENLTDDVSTLVNELIKSISDYKVLEADDTKGMRGRIEVTVGREPYFNTFGPGKTGKITGKAQTDSQADTNRTPDKARRDVLVQRELVAKDHNQQRRDCVTSSNFVHNYQDALNAFYSTTLKQIGPLPVRPSLYDSDLQTLCQQVAKSVHPSQTLERRVLSELQNLSPEASLAQPLYYPEIRVPVVTLLEAISPEYVIPNINNIPYNSITLLDSNQTFIEALFAGMNHEMARELLWNEYPTDQRGSYFRRFWDTQDNLSTVDPPMDIRPMDEWTGELGNNIDPAHPRGPLVLVIRGELLRKYPNTVVYAQRAAFPQTSGKPNYSGVRTLADPSNPDNIKFPIFHGQLRPDVIIFGFDFTNEDPEGSREIPASAGWFFVFKERPGQVEYGLDDAIGGFPPEDATSPDNLTWAHLVHSEAELNCLEQINLSRIQASGGIRATVEFQARWKDASSADFADILLQDPALFARHASWMLP
jgi:hypothetical protein